MTVLTQVIVTVVTAMIVNDGEVVTVVTAATVAVVIWSNDSGVVTVGW
jgi:thiamine phosphate synthase YjbQ (UPF0047 family)